MKLVVFSVWVCQFLSFSLKKIQRKTFPFHILSDVTQIFNNIQQFIQKNSNASSG